MQRNLLSALAVVLLAYSCIATASALRDRPVRSDAVDVTRQAIAHAAQQVHDKDATGAAATFAKAITSTGFEPLPEDERYRALTIAAAAASDAGDYKTALDWSTRACASPAAAGNADLWRIRLEAAYRLENYPDSARSLAMISLHWPKELETINVIAINRITSNLANDRAHADQQFEVLSSLFNAGWTSNGQQPSWRWLQLTRMWLDRGNLTNAAAVAARIDLPHAILALRVDKQYDKIPRAEATMFDIERAKPKYVAVAQEQARLHPKQLEYSMELQSALLETMLPERALRIADEIIAKIGDGDGRKMYDDFDEYYLWILNNRAEALWDLGRQDDAIEQMRRAARRPEHGELNVSQAINLSGYYAMRGDTDKALDAISDLGQLSPFGRMQREGISVISAVQRNDAKKLETLIDYMRAHKDDALSTYQNALIDANRLDAAADLLVERLRDANTRSDAMLAMQRYAEHPETPLIQTRRSRWRSVIARPDVQSVLARVGRIEQVALYE